MYVSQRTLPDLARGGILATRHRSSEVDFEIHHMADRAGYLFALEDSGKAANARDEILNSVIAKGQAEQGEYYETLSSASHGAGLVIRTAIRSISVLQPLSQLLSGENSATRDDSCDDVWVFRGGARPNPGFVYDPGTALEGIIILDVEPRRLLVAHGEAIHRALLSVANAAVGAKAPLIYVQSPVQLPSPSYNQEDLSRRVEDWARSSSLAIRFAISIGRRSSQDRMRLAAQLADVCTSEGWGLELRDTRPEHRSGNWFSIVRHEPGLVRARIGTAGRRNASSVTQVCPITLVGPARVGSTQAVARFLDLFQPASLLGVSIASLDDLAFIHVLVALPSSARETRLAAQRGLERWLNEAPQHSLPPRFGSLLESLGLKRKSMATFETDAALVGLAGDYQLFAGPLVATKAMAPASRALWFYWDIEKTKSGLAAPLVSLAAALRRVGLAQDSGALLVPDAYANVDYLICRDVGDATLRAKGKLSIPDELRQTLLPGVERAVGARRLAQALEEAWRHEFHEASRLRGDLHVAWQEAWLSRGTY